MPGPVKVVLVVGSCGLDRLLTVPKYPNPDDKVRTTDYNEVGGGNAANTAAAMGRLRNASFLRNQNLQIRLLTKLGDDAVGQQLLDELQISGVDISSPFLIRPPGSTTAFTTIIVSEDNHTRTCLHTPGTCGELKIEEFEGKDMDALFENVVHLHSDSRHTDASLWLAKEAKRRGIPVSTDSEKDRKTKALDELMLLSGLIFTNSNYLGYYLKRLHSENEQRTSRPSLGALEIHNAAAMSPASADSVARSMTPSAFYSRWHPEQIAKQVVVTQGHMGALLFTALASTTSEAMSTSASTNKATIGKGKSAHSLAVDHSFSDTVDGQQKLIHTTYTVETAGVIEDVTIVDSTGAGDAFIGGYIVASLVGNDPKFSLDFGGWVAGQKLQGPGAQSSLPWGDDVDGKLGTDVDSIKRRLGQKLTTFNAEPSLASLESNEKHTAS